MKKLIYLVVFLIISCAKDRPYEAIYKESEIVSKSLIATADNPGKSVVFNEGNAELEQKVNESVYLYIPTVEQGGYYNAGTRSFFVGEEKLASFKITKDKLEIYSFETEDNVIGNQLNSKPIIEFPIEHKSFRCAKNSDDECSNKEEENDDISWKKKDLMDIDFEGMKILEVDTLPIGMQNLFTPCQQEVSSKVVSHKIDADSVHIIVDKTFKTNLLCSNVRTFEDLQKTAFKQRFHYQFKKLVKLASKDYKSIVYDKTKFGYFYTTKKDLSADNRVVYYSEKHFLKRFSPDKLIPYYLSENLFKPENSKILQATKDSIGMINDSLKKAGAKMQLDLMASPREEGLQNIKNSIILVEEPLSSGLLGYGPSISNPLTGEILQAQTVMYLGNHIKFIRRTYDQLVAEASKVETPEEDGKVEETQASQAMVEQEFSDIRHEYVTMRIEQSRGLQLNQWADFFEKQRYAAYAKTENAKLPMIERMNALLEENQSAYDIMSQNNMFSGEFLNMNKLLSDILKKEDWKLSELKPWTLLGDAEREDIIDLIVPHIWKSVLIHEIGHNLGLRHNFSASEDKENFYSDDELAEMGIEQKIPFSSVMDYTYSDLNALPVMGKYDIAALMYGYAQKMETKDGELLSFNTSTSELSKTELDSIKAYKYCSDEGVYLNATCNRFDEGTTITEIIDHYISAYYKSYKYSNTKLDKLNFSSYDNLSALRSKYARTFFPLRRFFELFELYDDYHKQGRIPETSPAYKQYVELAQGVTKIAQFSLSILKESDAHCKLINITNMQASWYPLSFFNETSCHALEPMGSFHPVAQVGLPLNNIKSLRNTSASIDEIDVRGYWLDKMLAMNLLTQKVFGITSMDKYADNFVSKKVLIDSNGKTVGEAINELMNEAIDGVYKKKAIVSYKDGSTKEEDVSINQSAAEFIPNSTSYIMNRVMGFKKGQTHLTKILLDVMLGNTDGFDAKFSSPLVKDFILFDTVDASRPNTVSTQFGTFSFYDGSSAIKSIVEKMNVPEEVTKKDQSTLAVIATGIVDGKTQEQILIDVDAHLLKSGEGLYTQYKQLFDFLSTTDSKIVEDVIAGKTDEVDPSTLEELQKLPKELLEIKVANAEAKGLDLAQKFNTSIIGTADSFKDAVAALDGVSAQTLISVVKGTLNTKTHYEKVLSSLSL
mgnify:CR=1 FL=1